MPKSLENWPPGRFEGSANLFFQTGQGVRHSVTRNRQRRSFPAMFRDTGGWLWARPEIQRVPTGRPDAGLHDRACHDRLSRSEINAPAEARFRPGGDISCGSILLQQGDATMADALSLPIAEI